MHNDLTFLTASTHANAMPAGNPVLPLDAAAAQGLALQNLQTFRNPLLTGADPAVAMHKGQYHLIQSDRRGIVIHRSATLGKLGQGESQRVFHAPAFGKMSRNLWAPELHFLDGRWYIYFAADDGRNENHRMYVLESASDDPFGPYSFQGKIACPAEDRWAIDGTVLTTPDGQRYFAWSGWDGRYNVQQNIYLAPMASPTRLADRRVCISCPTEAWERRSGRRPCYVNEGPAALIRHGRIFMAYSANGFWSDDYCLGLLTCSLNADPLNAGSWTKHHGPVFAKTDDAFNVGHNCFISSPDGKEDWILYHAVNYPRSGGRHRTIRAQRFDWNADGTPHFGRPASVLTPHLAPSGENAQVELFTQ